MKSYFKSVGDMLAKVQVQTLYLNTVKVACEKFSIDFAEELLSSAKDDAINLLKTIGYTATNENVYEVLVIAYNKLRILNRFNCTFNSLDLYIVSDIESGQYIIKNNSGLHLYVVLNTMNGIELFTLKTE